MRRAEDGWGGAAAGPAATLVCYNAGAMKNAVARQVGQRLKADLETLRALAKEARAKREPEAEAIEIAIVNLNSAIDILTE